MKSSKEKIGEKDDGKRELYFERQAQRRCAVHTINNLVRLLHLFFLFTFLGFFVKSIMRGAEK
jgi:hypothetical protein